MADLLTVDDSFEMESMKSGPLTGVGNIVLNAVLGTLTNMLGVRLDYSLPECIELTRQDSSRGLVSSLGAAMCLIVQANMVCA